MSGSKRREGVDGLLRRAEQLVLNSISSAASIAQDPVRRHRRAFERMLIEDSVSIQCFYSLLHSPASCPAPKRLSQDVHLPAPKRARSERRSPSSLLEDAARSALRTSEQEVRLAESTRNVAGTPPTQKAERHTPEPPTSTGPLVTNTNKIKKVRASRKGGAPARHMDKDKVAPVSRRNTVASVPASRPMPSPAPTATTKSNRKASSLNRGQSSKVDPPTSNLADRRTSAPRYSAPSPRASHTVAAVAKFHKKKQCAAPRRLPNEGSPAVMERTRKENPQFQSEMAVDTTAKPVVQRKQICEHVAESRMFATSADETKTQYTPSTGYFPPSSAVSGISRFVFAKTTKQSPAPIDSFEDSAFYGLVCATPNSTTTSAMVKMNECTSADDSRSFNPSLRAEADDSTLSVVRRQTDMVHLPGEKTTTDEGVPQCLPRMSDTHASPRSNNTRRRMTVESFGANPVPNDLISRHTSHHTSHRL